MMPNLPISQSNFFPSKIKLMFGQIFHKVFANIYCTDGGDISYVSLVIRIMGYVVNDMLRV